MTEAVTGLVDAFYSRFLLRDVFAKVVPGGIIAWALVAALSPPEAAVATALALPLWAWLVAIGPLWVSGFAVQSITGNVSFFNIDPKAEEQASWDATYALCRRQASERDLREIERIIVIKEAKSNTAGALSCAALLLGLDGAADAARLGYLSWQWLWHEALRLGPTLILVGIAILALAVSAKSSAKRQVDLMRLALTPLGDLERARVSPPKAP